MEFCPKCGSVIMGRNCARCNYISEEDVKLETSQTMPKKKEVICINNMSESEQSFYSQIKDYYRKNPSHMDFSNYWRAEGQRAVWSDCSRKECVNSLIFKICQDLDSRLAIKEGHLRL